MTRKTLLTSALALLACIAFSQQPQQHSIPQLPATPGAAPVQQIGNPQPMPMAPIPTSQKSMGSKLAQTSNAFHFNGNKGAVINTIKGLNQKQPGDDPRNLPLSQNGKLLSVGGQEVNFRRSDNRDVTNICYTPRPYIDGGSRDASCGFVVPCDNPANRDAASTTLKYFQLEWHVMWNGGASSNIDQTRIDALMAELNADFASHNMIFCADPANFYEDPGNWDHDENTEEVSLKTTYNVTPTQVINIYVVGQMGPGGYARFPYDPMGGTSATGGVVLNRGNCSVGTHTLAHELGHSFGLEHTFAGVDERSQCSSCYEKVRNVNGSSNTTGVPTPNGGPYTQEGDQEGDWCSDTNPHDTYTYQCSTSSNPNGGCDSNPWANAPVNNHMSYSFCSTQFTAQQERRMHCMLNTYLGSWIAYGGGVCGAQPPTADFVGNPTTWQAPSNVTFTDLTQPSAIVTSWNWTFDVGGGNGVTCVGCVGPNATYTGQTPPVVTYPNPGLYTVSLNVTSANGPSTETKIDYIEVLAPAGDCDTLTTQWENVGPTVITYGFGGGWITGVQDPVNSVLPTDPKGVYERYFTPNPGVTQVGAIRVGLGGLNDADADMRFQVSVYDDDGAGAPGALLGGRGGLDPTALGVPGIGFFTEFWVPLFNAQTPTTGTFHVAVEIFPGDATDSLIVMSSCLGPPGCPVAEGEADASNHIFTTGFGFENLLTIYGADFDVDIIPMLGEWAPDPIITGFTENVVCDTTFVTLFDTVLYTANPDAWGFEFADGTVLTYTSDPMTINRTYTTPGPDTVTVYAVNSCGRSDTNVYIIPYNFLATPDAEFTKVQANPICAGAPGVDFNANTSGYDDYFWDFGDGTTTSTGGTPSANHVYATPGLYYVSLTTTTAGFAPLDTFYLENFESGWPAGYDRYDNDASTPNAGVNPPWTGTNATAWLDIDVDGNGNTEAASTSWNVDPLIAGDDWMLTTAIGPLPAGQRLYWDAQAYDNTFADGYEVRISTTQLPANTTNYSTMLFSIGAENTFSTTRGVDLSAYAGQTVYIAFRNNSLDDYILSIDNIRVGTAAPGCNATRTIADFVEIIDCTVIPPTAVLNADVTSGCAPLTVTFTDATTVGDPATSWLWNFGDGNFSTAQNPPPHVYTTPGTYFVSFEACNAGGCSTDYVTITVGTPPTIDNIVTVDPSCIANNGSITITASSGTPPLQYSIDNGVTFQAGNSFTGLGAASYDVVVEDALGCQATQTVALTTPTGPSISNVALTDPSCNGNSNGSIVITAGGGTPPLQYSIDNGVTFQAGNSFTGLGAATYNIVVEDASGCQATTTGTLTDPPVITYSAAVTDPTCNGGANGSIVITAGGGTPPLQYSIDNGVTFQAGNSFTGLGAATYNVVVEDANGCQFTTTETLTDPAAVTYSAVNTNPTCNGDTDGSIVLTGAGGDGGPYNYSIDNGVTFQASGSFTGLGAGTYNIVVEDASGCQVTGTETLTDPAAVTYSAVNTNPTCNGDTDGSIVLTGAGGDGGPYQYSIDNGGTFQGSGVFTGLGAGTYNIVVEDGSGCQVTGTETLTDPALVTYSAVNTDPTCANNDGSIVLTGAGGDGGPYQYSIDNGGTFQASGTFNGLAAGTYNIVVEDASGCQVTGTETLTLPTGPTIDNVATTDPTCGNSDGTITITASGGTPPYQYSIDNGVTFQASNNFTGLAAGTYDIVVEDAGGCQATTTVSLTNVGAPSIDNITAVDPTCNGGSDGSITITASGGTSPYQYSIDNGVTFQAGNSFTGLGAASYAVVVEDALGCQVSQNVVLTDPPAVTYSAVNTDPTCNGDTDGSIVLTGAGGDGGPYNYSIDNGVTFQASGTFAGLGAGTYNIVIEDASGCQGTGTETLTDPAVVTYSAVVTNASCNGALDGSIVITAGGGDGGPYQYSIDNGTTFQASGTFNGLGAGTYDIVVEDASGCQVTGTETITEPAAVTYTVVLTDPTCGASNGSIVITGAGGDGGPYSYSIDNGVTFQASGTFTGLAAGNYDVVVEDGSGCQVAGTETLNNAGGPSIDNVAVTDPTCNGDTDGSIIITASGGTSPYQYSIDNGVTFQASNTFTGLGAGVYDIVVEDANTCQSSTQVTLTDPPVVTYSTVNTDPSCNGDTDGSIVLTGAGGDGGPYQYSIDNGTTFQASGSFTGLGAGTYDIVVEDASGCQVTGTETLTDPPVVTYTTVVTDPSCGANDGSIVITGAGGDGGPYQYSIDNGTTFQASGSFTGLGVGTYDIIVEDGSGCQATGTETLTNPGAPTIDNVTTTDPSCGGNDGQIDITASGGVPPYQYSIDNGTTFQAGNSFTGLAAGTYDIVVEDANGCQASTTVTLNGGGGGPSFTTAVVDPLCNGGIGTITVTPSGGTSPYQYSADGGVLFQGSNVLNVPAGSYDVVVEDANGCQSNVTTIVVNEPAPLVATAGADGSICEGDQITITSSVTGGTSPYTYTWICDQVNCNLDNSNAQNPNATPTVTTTYYIQVTDANGCSSNVDSLVVTVNPLPTVDAGADVTITNGTSTLLDATVFNGAAFAWTPSSTLDDPTIEDPTATPDVTTTYYLVVTSGAGCIATDSVTVTVEDGEVSTPTAFTPDNDGTNDLWIIENLSTSYPEAVVEVYNRWGNKIFESDPGYTQPWDGTFEGNAMPVGSYYYIINFNDGTREAETGTITIIK